MSDARSGGPVWRRYLRFWGANTGADVRDELQFHIDMRAREYEAQGMTPADARRAAQARFGDVARVDAALRAHDDRRDRSGQRREVLASVWHDVRYAVRALARSPGFALAAILCLALGTGANAAVFSVINAFLFRPLPVASPGNLVVVASLFADEPLPASNSYPDYLDIRAQHQVFQSAIAYQIWPVSLRVGDRGERRILEAVSDNYWPTLGLPMIRGRPFTPEEAQRRAPSIVISYALWRREFGSASDVIGRSVTLDGVPMTIVGVAPPSFQGLTSVLSVDGWVPATLMHQVLHSAPDQMAGRSVGGFRVIARLRSDVTVDAARHALALLAANLKRQYPVDDHGRGFVVEPELRARPDIAVSGILPQAAIVFSILAALVLLIACANVASLMLTRVSGRRTELAVRVALGARRIRIVRQLLTESLVVAFAGATVGAGAALAVMHRLTTLPFTTDVPVRMDLHMDWRVLGVTVIAAVAAAIVSGLGPALRSAKGGVGEALKEGARGGATGAGRHRFRTFLVASQVAVSFVLLVSAGLFLRSVQRASHVDLGFRQDHGLLATIDVSLARYDAAQGQRFFRTLEQRASTLPGVRVAALASQVPLGTSHNTVDLYADLPTLATEKGHTTPELVVTTPGYFDALGIPLRSGRDFTDRDDSAAPRVLIINAAMAARLWPGQDPVGQRVRTEPDGPAVQIVGVVGTVTARFLGEQPLAIAYLPFGQDYQSQMTLHLRTNGDPSELAVPVRALVASLDANLAPYDITTMANHLGGGIAFVPVRLAAALATGIGVLGLLLAVIGLYGVIAYSVVQRRREIGIRMAMGATSGDILWGVVREGLVITGVGLVAGGILAVATTRVLGSLLIDVSARDPLTFAVLAGVLTAATLAASWIPAWRAATVAPASAIRTT